MRSQPLFLVLILFILLFCKTPTHGSTILEVALYEMLEAAEFVFEGEVIDAIAEETQNGSAIHTYVTFQILEIIKGQYPHDTIELRFLGGKVGDLILRVSEMHIPEMGEKGLYFVESLSRHQIHPLLGWSQGHLLIVPDENGTERVLSRDHRPIMSIESDGSKPSRKPQVYPFSKGVARGLVIGERDKTTSGLSAGEFKAKLRRNLEGMK